MVLSDLYTKEQRTLFTKFAQRITSCLNQILRFSINSEFVHTSFRIINIIKKCNRILEKFKTN